MADYGVSSSSPLLSASHGQVPEAGWDYAITLRLSSCNDPDDATHRKLLTRLNRSALSYSQTSIPSQNLLIIRIGLSEDAMKAAAEILRLQLRTLPEFGAGFQPFSIANEHIFDNNDRVQRSHPYFTPADRVFLTLSVIRSRDTHGAAIDLSTLLYRKKIKHAFAIHAEPDRSLLIKEAVFKQWWNPTSKTPLNRLRQYLGTRIALYFAWLSFYNRMLFSLAAIAIIVQTVLHHSSSNRLTAITRLFFSLALSFWSAYAFGSWKRRNAILNVQWGTTSFYESHENQIRPDFIGDTRSGFYCRGGWVDLSDMQPDTQPTSIVQRAVLDGDGEQVSRPVIRIGAATDTDFVLEAAVTGRTFSDLPSNPFFNPLRRNLRLKGTAIVTAFFASCVAAAAFSILFFKSRIINLFGADTYGRFVPGIATALLISVADPLWKIVSLRLTVWENHRTNYDFQNSLIRKRFAFQFVSNYISLFYVAFVKPFTKFDPCTLDEAGNPNCMLELGSLLTSLVITKATLQQVIELGVPSIAALIRGWIRRRRAASHTRSNPESQVLLEGVADSDPLLSEAKKNKYQSTIDDYGEVVIQYGMMVLFGLAFPLAALINLLNNLLERRTDVYKILVVNQRPDTEGAADIGWWIDVLKFLTTLSVITNTALVTITSPALQQALPNFIGDTAEKYRGLSFFIFEHILLLIRFLVSTIVPDVPESTYLMLARQEFVIAKSLGTGWKSYYGNDPGDSDDPEKQD